MKPKLEYTFADFAAEEPLDLALGALLIAREVDPRLDPQTYLSRLDRMAAELEPRVIQVDSGAERLVELGRFLFEELGFRGNEENYYDPRNSYLSDVMDRRLGIPITLSVLYMEIGKRVGLPLCGVNFPSHFLVLCDIPQGPLYVDPFAAGSILRTDELERLLPDFEGHRLGLDEAFLQPASAREILARMLRNLKAIHAQKQRYREAISAGEKINMLQPEAAGDHRDLGYLYFRVGAYHQALSSFEEYLRRADTPADDAEIRRNIQVIGTRLGALN